MEIHLKTVRQVRSNRRHANRPISDGLADNEFVFSQFFFGWHIYCFFYLVWKRLKFYLAGVQQADAFWKGVTRI